MTATSTLLLLLAATVLSAARPPAQITPQPRYRLILLQGDEAAAAGIAKGGTLVVGTIDPIWVGGPVLAVPKPCFWMNGKLHALPPISATAAGFNNAATHVNARGSIAGSMSYGSDLFASHATLWRFGQAEDLGTLPGDAHSSVNGINDRDEVVGYSAPLVFYFGGNRAFHWARGQMVELPPLPGMPEAQALDINNPGTVIGLSGDLWDFFAGTARPVVWQNGEVHALPLPAGASQGQALVINDRGEIAGQAGMDTLPFSSFDSRPVLWDPSGQPRYLPMPAGDSFGTVRSINEHGDMVGTTGGFKLVPPIPFPIQVVEPTAWIAGKAYRLSDICTVPAGFDWSQTQASAIDDRRLIVGTGVLDGKPVAFMALPW